VLGVMNLTETYFQPVKTTKRAKCSFCGKYL